MKTPAVILISTFAIGCSSSAVNRVSLSSDEEKAAYAVGYETSQILKKGVSEQDLDIYLDQFMSAMRAGLEADDKNLLLSKSEISTYIDYHRNRIAEKTETERLQSAQSNLQEGNDFRAENSRKNGVIELDNGLQYEVLIAGNSNEKANTGDTVTVHYHGTFPDGTVFDSSVDRGEPITFPLKNVIEGWQTALQLMSKGDKWRVIIPPELAYGESGSGGAIGPNQTLIFDIELIEVARGGRP